MQKVELTEGAWAEFDDPKRVPERKRRAVIDKIASGVSNETREVIAAAAAKGEQPTEEVMAKIEGSDLTTMLETIDVAIVALVSSWSFDVEPSLDALLDLPGADYDLLRDAAMPLVDQLSPNFEPNPAPTSPTAPSSV